jgi:hypothetical protein
VTRRERPTDRDLGHPEGGEHASGAEAERLRGLDEGLDRDGIDRLGPAERERQR